MGLLSFLGIGTSRRSKISEAVISKNRRLVIVGSCSVCMMPVLGVLEFSNQPDIKTCKCK